MEIKDMNIEQIEERMSQIDTELNNDDADLEALKEEVRTLKERKEEIRKAAIEAEEARKKAAQEVITVRTFKEKEEKMEERIFDVTSKEYRTAFLKNLMGLEMTEEERTAYVHTTANSSAVLPTTMVNEIWDAVQAEHAILGDVTIYRTGTVLEIPVRTAIAAGDAATASEGAAPSDDEKNTFTKVTLSGKDFAKDVEISYALGQMSIDGFEAYLTKEIADRLANALANDVFTQIAADIANANELSVAVSGTLAWSDVTGAFAALENAPNPIVYAKRSTIYNYIAGMVDDNGRPIFQPNAQEGLEGYLLGAPVKVDDGAPVDTLVIGDSKKIAMNVVQDIMVEADRDIKKHVHIYSGYCRAESALIFDKAFVTLDVTPSA